MPGTRRRSAGVRPASRSTSASSAPRSRRKPCVCRRRAARARASPPPRGCARRRRSLRAGRARRASHSACASSSWTCSRSALRCLDFTRSAARKRSVVTTAPSRHERAARARRSSTRVSCIEPPPMSSATPSRQRGRVDDRQVAVARLLLAREHLDLEPRPLARGAHELLAVGRLADRGGGERPDPLDPRRAAEVREQLDRLERPLHRPGLERPAGLLVLAHAHRLVDLVGALPPRRPCR